MNPQDQFNQTPEPTPAPSPAPSPQQNPYEFIMSNGQQQPKRAFGLPTGGSKLQKVLLFGGGGVIVLVLIFMLLSLLGGGNKTQNEQLLVLAQEQTEILRITALAKNERSMRTTDAQNLAINTSLAVQSSNQETLALLKKAKVKTNEKVLALKKNAKTDATLTVATKNNNYDEVFTTVITEQLKTYRGDIQKLYKQTSNKNTKAVLETAYKGASILLNEQAQ